MILVLNIVSVCVVLGVFAALVQTILTISAHAHFANGTPFLAALAARDAFSVWPAGAIVCGFALGLGALAVASRRRNKAEAGGSAKREATPWIARIVCLVLFLSVGWIVNRRWLPGKFEPVSLLADLLVVLSVGFLYVVWTRPTLRPGLFRTARVAAIVLLAAILAFEVSVRVQSRKLPGNHPNVIFVVCETLRPDHLGCYGYPRDTTPNLDAFARGAFRFTRAYTTAPATRPGMMNILTGAYFSDTPLSLDRVTLAEYFRTLRYATAAFISQQFFAEKGANTDQGFDHYDAPYDIDQHRLSSRRAQSVADATLDWLRARPADRPFFVWCVYFDPHDPYVAPNGYRGYYNKTDKFNGDRRAEGIHGLLAPDRTVTEEHRNFLIRAYEEEIRYFDAQVGRLFDYLKESGAFDESWIVVTSDHGEELGDNGGRWDHCQLLSEEEIHVPLLVKMPGQAQGATVDSVVQTIDLFPALVDYLAEASDPPAFREWLEGDSLLPLLVEERRDDADAARDRAALAFWGEQEAAVRWPYKYWLRDGNETVVDLRTGDAATSESVRSGLRKALDDKIAMYGLRSSDRMATIEQLRSVGYLK
ncbi:sulfatase [Candidatus Sumerlaeota bacterium]|nr:sulfatase [Candidatus Sumerlaeota bacterium]